MTGHRTWLTWRSISMWYASMCALLHRCSLPMQELIVFDVFAVDSTRWNGLVSVDLIVPTSLTKMYVSIVCLLSASERCATTHYECICIMDSLTARTNSSWTHSRIGDESWSWTLSIFARIQWEYAGRAHCGTLPLCASIL